MCGRTACTLDRDDIVKACSYQDRKGRRQRPVWKDAPGGQQYKTSYNLAPGAFTPVLMSSKHFKDMEEATKVDHVVMPMKWGMVPQWHKESPSKVSFKTSNCRGETMMEKPTYKTPLQKGRRCVVVMDGFFEWKTTSSGKQPHYFQFATDNVEDLQNRMKSEEKDFKDEDIMKSENKLSTGESRQRDSNNIKIESTSGSEQKMVPCKEIGNCETSVSCSKVECSAEIKSECKPFDDQNHCPDEDGVDVWTGQRLLTCAAVYDVWQPSNTSSPLYSYSIITVAASKDMAWCHHRMPAVLTTDQEIYDWLDVANIPLHKAHKLIQSKADCLISHPVSKNVNYSHYQTPDCIKPVDPGEEKKISGSGMMMMNWLKRSASAPTATEGSPVKKTKL